MKRIRFRYRTLIAICIIGANTCAVAEVARLAAPNVVVISPSLATLKAQGFGAVIYLAPPTVADAVPNELSIVTDQGLTFVNLPIRFDNPTDTDFEIFATTLRGLADRKVLVHCQINLRASSMVFLYRAIVLKEDPRVAFEAVAGVWSPDGPWRRYIEAQLRKHQVAFELL